MSDTSLHHRRQPPSPLVFSPDAILSPSPLQAQQSIASINHSSTSNTVSMPFVRRHVTRRLRAAKADCDKELQRITNNITTFFEERLREGDFESERDRRDRDHDSLAGDLDHIRDSFYHHPSEFGSLQNDEYSSDGGYDPEPEFGRHSRQRVYPSHLKSLPTHVNAFTYSIHIGSDEPCFSAASDHHPMGSPS